MIHFSHCFLQQIVIRGSVLTPEYRGAGLCAGLGLYAGSNGAGYGVKLCCPQIQRMMCCTRNMLHSTFSLLVVRAACTCCITTGVCTTRTAPPSDDADDDGYTNGDDDGKQLLPTSNSIRAFLRSQLRFRRSKFSFSINSTIST